MSEPVRIWWVNPPDPKPKDWQELVGRVGVDET
jgi:hypothetical protein